MLKKVKLEGRYRAGEYVEKNMEKAFFIIILATEQRNPMGQKILYAVFILMVKEYL